MNPPVESLPADGSQNDYRHNLLKAAAAQCCEHFDSVVIIATVRGARDTTHMMYAGSGNHYASIAAAERWVTKNKTDWKRHD